MLAEFVEKLVTLCEKAVMPRKLMDLHNHETWYNPESSTTMDVLKDEPPIHLTVDSLGHLAEAVLAYWNPGDGVHVEVNRGSIVATLDPGGWQRGQISMNLCDTTAYDALRQQNIVRTARDQRDMIHWLRKHLLDSDVIRDLLGVLRSLKISKTTDGEGVVKMGDESISRMVKNKALAGGKDIPDMVTLRVPVYRQLNYDADIRCLLDIDFANDSFLFLPVPEDLENAWRTARNHVVGVLRAELPADGTLVVSGGLQG